MNFRHFYGLLSFLLSTHHGSLNGNIYIGKDRESGSMELFLAFHVKFLWEDLVVLKRTLDVFQLELISLSMNVVGKLDILGQDGDPLGMHST